MSMTDPIADLFTRLRNAGMARRRKVDIPHSNLKESVVDLLVREGFVAEKQVTEVGGRKRLRAYLRLDEDGKTVIGRIERVSRPGCRIYRKARQVPPVLRGMGVGIYSTSSGVFTDRECRQQRLGGEYLGRVW
ncbi:MAG: 30S ribosomal protein S8 [Planctomycetota bacterium]|jgi:small subunit ribosomal protein S8